MKRLLSILLLLPVFAFAQNTTTVIPGSLRVVKMAHNSALNDSVVIVDVNNNFKKAVIPGGGGSATGVNGLNGTTNIGLGGTLGQNTFINNNGFIFRITQASGNILQGSDGSTVTSQISSGGQFYGTGLSNILTGNNSQVVTSATGVFINRNINDGHPTLTVQNYNCLNTADILRVNNAPSNQLLSVGYNGFLNKSSYNIASAGGARGSLIQDVLQPTANNDVLVGMDIRPVFGTSIIAGFNTLVGGSGYGNGTYFVFLTGGTGAGATAQLTATSGAITAISGLNAGVNYTVGDVLGATVYDPMGNTIGSGFSVKVASVSSYTGITGYALRTYGRDTYDQDYSSQFQANDKVNKTYVDNRVISGSYSLFASATTTFTVSIGSTQPNNTYKVQVTPTSPVAAALFYVTNKTTTTFDVVYPAGLNGSVTLDWSIMK